MVAVCACRVTDTLAKHFNLVTEKVELSVAEPLLAKLDEIKARNRTKT